MALGKPGPIPAPSHTTCLPQPASARLGSVGSNAIEKQIRAYFRTLYRAWGPQHWWPGRGRFEVIAGAFLVQNTGWSNVELALRRLRDERALTLGGIRRLPLARLQSLVRPAGYFRQKARHLKDFVTFLDQRYGGSLDRMFGQPIEPLRLQLLSLPGVGPETADSILLYAGQHPVFVVDAYARRILGRHGLVSTDDSYDRVRARCERALRGATLPPSKGRASHSGGHRPSRMSQAQRSPLAQRYNEMHGLLVLTGKRHCLKLHPRCEGCPLQPFLPPSGPTCGI